MKIIDKIAFIYVKDGKILATLSKGKDTYYIPGGKREGTEKDEDTLIRECKEELDIDIKEDTIKFLIKEITDTVYKTISDFYKKTISWNDPLVEAISKMDVEKIYEICYYSEKKLWWRRKLVRLAYNIFR